MGRRDIFGHEYRDAVRQLVKHRKAAGMTQTALAEAIGTDQSQISKFERCERRIDILDYARICRAISIDPGPALRGVKLGRSGARPRYGR